MSTGVQGFAGGAKSTCRLHYKDLKTGTIGFAIWIGHFLPGIAAVFRGFTKIKNEGQRQYQQIIVIESGTIPVKRG